MNRLLILYPELFACRSKFNRKIKSLTSRINDVSLHYMEDPHGYIIDYAKTLLRYSEVSRLPRICDDLIDYAIVFDDGEEFSDELRQLRSMNIPTRWVKVPITRVINLKTHPHFHRKNDDTYVYIGRGSYWGNPHAMHLTGEDRKEVIRKYRYDFEYDKFINIDTSRVFELSGKRLGCYCKPAACHGDVLADYLNAYDDGK